MPVELFRKFQDNTGIKLIEGYGLTEATVCSSITPPDEPEPRIGSIGLPLRYTQMKTVKLDSDGLILRECETNEVGLLLISGPAVTPGYTDKEKNRDLFITDEHGDIWLNSGDLARCDDDGYFWLTGREKELIIRGGHNIDPKSIEEVLAAHSAVNLVAAIGRPDQYAGEIPVAYVDTVSETSELELLEYCQNHIGERAAIPKSVIIMDRLPVTGVGKIHKPTLYIRELENTAQIELAPYKEKLKNLEISAASHKKYGHLVSINACCDASEDPDVLKNKIEAQLGVYSFHCQVEIVRQAIK